jgi:hypothetical protein
VSTSLDASLVSAVARIQGITAPLFSAANTLGTTINLILKGLAENNIPVSPSLVFILCHLSDAMN